MKTESEENSLNILLDNHSKFRRFLAKHVESEAVAEDLLQDALVRAIRHKEDLPTEENVVAWFYRVMRNILIDHYRSKGSNQKKKANFYEDLVHLKEDQTPPADDLREEICKCLERLLPTIKPEYSELIFRIDMAGQAPQIVANELGVNPNNLTVRLHRARQALKLKLEQSCGACTKHACLNCTC